MSYGSIVPEGMSRDDVKKICDTWGWISPPDDVINVAVDAAKVDGKKLPDALALLGYLEKSRAEQILFQREEQGKRDQSPIDFLALNEPRVRDAKQKILATISGLQYFLSLKSEHLSVHPRMKDADIRGACERHECVLMLIQEKTDVLVFADMFTLKRYKQIAGLEVDNDPLKSNFKKAKIALAPKTEVSSFLHLAKNNSADMFVGGEEGGAERMGIIFSARIREDLALRKLANIHDMALELNASDIHIDPDHEGRIHLSHRVRGDMERITETLDAREYAEIKRYLIRQAGAVQKLERFKEPKDGMYQYIGRSQAYVRCSFIPMGHNQGGSEDMLSICLRLIPMEHGRVSLQEKGVDPEVIRFLKNAVTPDAGIVLLVGPTGSGKSTTIGGTVGLHEAIHGSKKTRYSVEDPIERFLPGITQFQIPYHLRGTGKGFALLLRQLLRHDPNMIWLGEIRDAETAEIAVQAAATGHLLISTIHADDAPKAVERLSNMVPPERRDLRNALIENLSLLVCQRLVKQLCPQCSTWGEPTEAEQEIVTYINEQKGLKLELPEKVKHASGTGCTHPGCRHGYVDRLPVNEVLNVTSNVKLIYMSENAAERYRLINKAVNIHMEESIMKKVREGETDVHAFAS